MSFIFDNGSKEYAISTSYHRLDDSLSKIKDIKRKKKRRKKKRKVCTCIFKNVLVDSFYINKKAEEGSTDYRNVPNK
jgi:hypothetical protein